MSEERFAEIVSMSKDQLIALEDKLENSSIVMSKEHERHLKVDLVKMILKVKFGLSN